MLDGRVAQHDPDAWLERFAARIATPGTVVLRHLDDLPAVLCPQLLAHLDAASGRARLIATAKERGGYGPTARLLDHFPASLVVPPPRYRAEDIADIAPVIIRQRTGRSPAPRLQPATFQTLIGLDWPGNIRELEAVQTSAVVQSMGSDITQAHLPPEYRSSPTRHRLASLERAERDTILQLFGQAGGGMQAGPEKIMMAGKPAVRFRGTGVMADGTRYTSTIVFAFNGTIEYFVNCQYTAAKAAEVTRACDQVVGSFHVNNASAAQGNPQPPQGQARTQAEQHAQSDLAALRHDANFASDLRTLRSDAQPADPDLATTKSGAALGSDCYNVSTIKLDASNVGADASIVSLDRDSLTADIGTATQDITTMTNDLANLSTSGLPATSGVPAAIAAAGQAIRQAAAEANGEIDQVNADVTQAYSVANGMAAGSCSRDGPGHPPAPIRHIASK